LQPFCFGRCVKRLLHYLKCCQTSQRHFFRCRHDLSVLLVWDDLSSELRFVKFSTRSVITLLAASRNANVTCFLFILNSRVTFFSLPLYLSALNVWYRAFRFILKSWVTTVDARRCLMRLVAATIQEEITSAPSPQEMSHCFRWKLPSLQFPILSFFDWSWSLSTGWSWSLSTQSIPRISSACPMYRLVWTTSENRMNRIYAQSAQNAPKAPTMRPERPQCA